MVPAQLFTFVEAFADVLVRRVSQASKSRLWLFANGLKRLHIGHMLPHACVRGMMHFSPGGYCLSRTVPGSRVSVSSTSTTTEGIGANAQKPLQNWLPQNVNRTAVAEEDDLAATTNAQGAHGRWVSAAVPPLTSIACLHPEAAANGFFKFFGLPDPLRDHQTHSVHEDACFSTSFTFAFSIAHNCIRA